jgi:broad specificity phosphatase PhoE
MVQAVRKMASSSTSSSTSAAVSSRGLSSTSSSSSKTLYVVRHGQAMHNPRAEAAKEEGCSMEEFFRLMREDDALDADLTDLGRLQAKQCNQDHFVQVETRVSNSNSCNSNNPLGIDLVVASCLSRTIDTADLVFPPYSSTSQGDDQDVQPLPPRRISIDKFREVNGDLLCAKRRTKSELIERNPDWNFDSLATEDDESWIPEIEQYEDAAERGYRGLVELLTGEPYLDDSENSDELSRNPETNNNNNVINTILLVCHGGILRYVMNIHPLVHLSDERTANDDGANSKTKSVEARFDNCELRKYRLSWKNDSIDPNLKDSGDGSRRAIVLTQLDH